jgi:hypothetical protein
MNFWSNDFCMTDLLLTGQKVTLLDTLKNCHSEKLLLETCTT